MTWAANKLDVLDCCTDADIGGEAVTLTLAGGGTAVTTAVPIGFTDTEQDGDDGYSEPRQGILAGVPVADVASAPIGATFTYSSRTYRITTADRIGAGWHCKAIRIERKNAMADGNKRTA